MTKRTRNMLMIGGGVLLAGTVIYLITRPGGGGSGMEETLADLKEKIDKSAADKPWL